MPLTSSVRMLGPRSTVARGLPNPADLNPVRWYDSDDLSTLTIKGGSNVLASWRDKSVNGYDLEQGSQSDGTQPIYTASVAAFGLLPAMDMRTNRYMRDTIRDNITDGVWNPDQTTTISTLAGVGILFSGDGALIAYSQAGSRGHFALHRQGESQIGLAKRGKDAGSVSRFCGGDGGSPDLFQFGMPYYTISTLGDDNQTNIWHNGLQVTSGCVLPDANTRLSRYQIGRMIKQTADWETDGYVAEVLSWHRVLSATELEAMHRYFIGKWNIIANAGSPGLE